MPVVIKHKEAPDHEVTFDFVNDEEWGTVTCTCGDSLDVPKIDGVLTGARVLECMHWALDHYKRLGIEPKHGIPSWLTPEFFDAA